MDTLSVAEKVEALLNQQFATTQDNPFSLDGAIMYGVSFSENEEQPDICFINSHDDVYELLSLPSTAVGRAFAYVALVTTGWAAPLPQGYNGDDSTITAPSQHPAKRRVRLIVCANRDEMASVIRFQDTDETVTDAGQATGALAEAISQFVS